MKNSTLIITNTNPVPVTIEQALKAQMDDLSIELIKATDKFGNVSTPKWKVDSVIPIQAQKTGVLEMTNSIRIKKYVGLVIQPFQSVHLNFNIKADRDR